MIVAVVGGNGRVGRELCFLLQNDGAEVRPIVRTQLAGSFLEYHDFDCTIADVTNQAAAREALRGVDLVVVAAFSRQYSQGFQPKETRKANANIVRNSVAYAPQDATIVYFSSIAVYGDVVNLSKWDWYAREKRNAEETLVDCCERHDKEGYALRMGPVVGEYQSRRNKFRDAVSNEAHLLVDAEKNSNVLHTVTIKDAVLVCGRNNFDRSIYTLVNHPRWTWRDVFEYYAPSKSGVYFHGDNDPSDSLSNLGIQSVKGMVEARERSLRAFSVYLPDRLNQFIFHKYVNSVVAGELEELKTNAYTHFSEFDQKPAPGPVLPQLPNTMDTLQDSKPLLE